MRRKILAACFLLLVPRPAAALTIVDAGADGANFADGEDAEAIAVSSDATNSAIAGGGRGGIRKLLCDPAG